MTPYDDPTPLAPDPALLAAGPETVPAAEALPPDWRDEDPASGDERPRRRGASVGEFFTGSILSREEFTRRLPVLVFVVMLMLLYIANGFRMQQKHARIEKLGDELQVLKTTAVTTTAVRMTRTRQSEIVGLLRQYNIPLILDEQPPLILETPASLER